MESKLHIDELALNICWEPIVIHLLEHRKGNHEGPRTIHTLDHNHIEVQNQEVLPKGREKIV